MAWQDYAEIQLRHAINDVDDPQRYTASRLQLAWLVGATYVINEFTLATNYVVDIVSMTINPDPTGEATLNVGTDQWTVNLITLRSAIMMVSNDLKLAANSAWAIKDVHMAADMKELYKANKMILDEVKDMYDKIRMQYMVGVNPQLSATLTPINILAGGYRAPLYGYEARDRMLF